MSSPDLTKFLCTNNTNISFSGGRTSAYMLWLTLQANGGVLPPDTIVTFANTGKEHPATLEFVQSCSNRWNVPIVWLEWQEDAPRYRCVDYDTAARNGEPFAKLIERKNRPPNPMQRFCTEELKVYTIERYLKTEKRWDEWNSFIGLRADEPERVARIAARCGARKRGGKSRTPLASAGITEADVLEFWRSQPFKLDIPKHLGNCDMCFLKGKAKLLQVLRDIPDAGDWWKAQEVNGTFHSPKRFRGRGYQGFIDAVASEKRGEGCADDWHNKQPWLTSDKVSDQPEVFDDLSDIECGCTD